MWIAMGSNNLGRAAAWVRAMSIYYRPTAEFAAFVPGARPLVAGKTAAADSQNSLSGSLPPPPGPLAMTVSTASLSSGKLMFAVPKGGPEELLQFIRRLYVQHSPSQSNAERIAFEKRKQRAIIEAADRILVAKVNPPDARKAFTYKINALKMLYRFRDPLVEDRLESLPSELERAGQADLIRNLRCVLLGQRLRRAGVVRAQAAREHLAAVRRCLQENGADITASFVANEAAQALLKSGDKAGAVKALDNFAGLFAHSRNHAVAQRASFLQQAAEKLRHGDVAKKAWEFAAAK